MLERAGASRDRLGQVETGWGKSKQVGVSRTGLGHVGIDCRIEWAKEMFLILSSVT